MADLKEVKAPDVGGEAVEVIEILVSKGDSVEAEDSLITVESDKASMDIPAPFAGVIAELKVKVGDKINEGDLLAMFEAAGDADGDTAGDADTDTAVNADAAESGGKDMSSSADAEEEKGGADTADAASAPTADAASAPAPVSSKVIEVS